MIRRFVLLSLVGLQIQTGHSQVNYSLHPETGALNRLSIREDPRGMNWMLETDGSQYKWVGKEYGWGLGYFSVRSGTDTLVHKWQNPIRTATTPEKAESVYLAGDLSVTVSRTPENGDLLETYTFSNKGPQALRLFDIGINTPFNDNYPDAATCFRARTNAHVWTGGHSAYVNAMHMSGHPPHLGLVVTEGAIDGYEIKERALKKDMSNTRGVIILNPEDLTLAPNESYTLSWRIFKHEGPDDFDKKRIGYGSVAARSKKYVYEQGEKAYVEFNHSGGVSEAVIELNGQVIPHRKQGNTFVAESQLDQPGEMVFELKYGNGKRTPVHCLVIRNEKELIRKRSYFILENQQLNDASDKRFGAYMVYDNELNKIYLNDTPNCNPVDRDEGRERVGMGVLLALMYQENKDGRIKESLLRYSDFVHRLQDKDYNTYSNTDRTGWNRNYNYPWIARFYFEMFRVTGDTQYLLDGYHTLKALYRNFGHNFYAIGLPMEGYHLLKENNYPEEAESLLEDFKKTGDTYLKNGTNYPTSEVNYEQSIVAPAVSSLLHLYLLTKEQKYLDGAKEQLPLLESFGGFQPSYHLNEIGIRHWDGYWFGKREFWGDTFPHYWSTLTAVAYELYAKCTGDASYKERAENILRNNLCLFFEDGKASCAFVYPDKVNGQKAFFYDPYANDQDWALVFYLMIHQKQ